MLAVLAHGSDREPARRSAAGGVVVFTTEPRRPRPSQDHRLPPATAEAGTTAASRDAAGVLRRDRGSGPARRRVPPPVATRRGWTSRRRPLSTGADLTAAQEDATCAKACRAASDNAFYVERGYQNEDETDDHAAVLVGARRRPDARRHPHRDLPRAVRRSARPRDPRRRGCLARTRRGVASSYALVVGWWGRSWERRSASSPASR